MMTRIAPHLAALVIAGSANVFIASEDNQIKVGDSVVVVTQNASLKVVTTIREHLQNGQRLRVNGAQGDWLWTSVETSEGQVEGWIHVRHVARDLEADLKKLLIERRETLRQRVKALEARFQFGATSLAPFTRAMTDLLYAELELCETPAERIAVHQELVRNTKRLEAQVKALRDMGLRGGAIEEYLAAKAARLTAEIGLLRERINVDESRRK